MKQNSSYSFSHTSFSYSQSIDETSSFSQSDVSVPISIFSRTSTLQALSRYLVDVRGMSFSQAARLLKRSPKTIWASYHQTNPLPIIDETKDVIEVPISIFSNSTAPLESLVLYIKSLGFRNADIAKMLGLDPRTTWTASKRGEARL